MYMFRIQATGISPLTCECNVFINRWFYTSTNIMWSCSFAIKTQLIVGFQYQNHSSSYGFSYNRYVAMVTYSSSNYVAMVTYSSSDYVAMVTYSSSN